MQESILKFEIRTRLSLNISEFCKEHGISRSTVSGWINKKRHISSRHIRTLKFLGISQDALEAPYKKINKLQLKQ